MNALISLIFAICLSVSAVSAHACSQHLATKNQGIAAVLVLGSKAINNQLPDWVTRRLDLAVETDQSSPVDFFVLTGGVSSESSLSEAEMMAQYLVEKKGISPEKIILEKQARDTRENAELTHNAILSKRTWNKITVITSDFHLDRVQNTFLSLLSDQNYPFEFLGASTGDPEEDPALKRLIEFERTIARLLARNH